MKQILLLTYLCLMAGIGHSQCTPLTFASSDATLDLDGAGTITTDCEFSPNTMGVYIGAVGTIGEEIAFSGVFLNILHSYSSDLLLTLTSPSGSEIVLSNENFGNAVNAYEFFYFDEYSEILVQDGNPNESYFLPQEGSLNDFFFGEEIQGYWTLKICDNYSADSGSIDTFEIDVCYHTPENDLCENALFIQEGNTEFNNFYASSETLFVPEGSTCYAQNGWCYESFATYNGIFFEFMTPSEPAITTINILPTGLYSIFDSRIALLDECSGNVLFANDDEDEFNSNSSFIFQVGDLEPSTSYIILVDNNDPMNAGEGLVALSHLVVGCTDPAACNYDSNAEQNSFNCEYPLDNDLCSGAIPIEEGYTSFTNIGACENGPLSVPGGMCEGISSWCTGDSEIQNDVYFSFTTPGYPAEIFIETVEGTFTDSQMAVFESCSGNLVGANDDSSDNLMSRLVFTPNTLEENSEYIILIDGYLGNSGDAELYLSILEGGCTDFTACNFDELAFIDDGSCEFTAQWYIPEVGGTGPAISSCEPIPDYILAEQECVEEVIAVDDYCLETAWDDQCYMLYGDCTGQVGCTDPTACNYDSEALGDDGSCDYTSQWYIPEVGGAGPAISSCEPIPDYILAEQECVEEVIAVDDYCLETAWDDQCYMLYGDCTGQVGCTDPSACNYDSEALGDDGSCSYPGDLCDDNNENTTDDEINSSCECEGEEVVEIHGCTDELACNYNSEATINDGSCESSEWYIPNVAGSGVAVLSCEPIPGYFLANQECVEEVIAVDDYCLEISWDEECFMLYGDCTGQVGCTDSTACNYDSEALGDDGSCTYDAVWYVPLDLNQGPALLSCEQLDGYVLVDQDCLLQVIEIDEFCSVDTWDDVCYNSYLQCIGIEGCTNSQACNFNFQATIDDDSCVLPGDSCDDTNENTINDVVQEDCSCEGELMEIEGCTDEFACNYNEAATVDDDSCEYVDLFSITGESFPVEESEYTYNYVNSAGSNYNWEITNGNIISGQGTAQITVSWNEEGDGSICVKETTDTECEGDEVCLSLEIITSINEYSVASLNVYPNPASEFITVELEGANQDIKELEIIDQTGKLVLKTNVFDSKTLNVSHLSKGLYSLRIKLDGGLVIPKRLLIQ